jgi:hypothetical protein
MIGLSGRDNPPAPALKDLTQNERYALEVPVGMLTFWRVDE